MMKTSLLVGIAVAAFGARAEAGGSPNSVGVGAEYELSGLGGASVNYDAGQFHLGGFIGYADDGNNNTDFELGGRFFYHLHSTAMSDFSVGGGIGLASDKHPIGMNMTQRNTYVFVEPSFQIRLFVASNVALSFTGGITIGAADAQGYGLTGQGVGGGSFTINGMGVVTGILGGAGVHYYFF